MNEAVISFSLRKKRAKLEELLEDRSVFIRIALDYHGVIVPSEFLNEAFLVLRISYHFRTDLVLHTNRLEQDLIFGDNYFRCTIPYDAIIFASNEKGMSYDFTSVEIDVAESNEDENKSNKESHSQPEDDTASKKNQTKGFLKRIK